VALVVEAQRLALMDPAEAQQAVATVLAGHLVQIAALRSYAGLRKVGIAAVSAINHLRLGDESGVG
jgi:hypothetical protein